VGADHQGRGHPRRLAHQENNGRERHAAQAGAVQ
jgi:hypothetical protein